MPSGPISSTRLGRVAPDHRFALVCAQGLHHDYRLSERAGAVFKINHGRVIAAHRHDLGNRTETFNPAAVQPGTGAELFLTDRFFMAWRLFMTRERSCRAYQAIRWSAHGSGGEPVAKGRSTFVRFRCHGSGTVFNHRPLP